MGLQAMEPGANPEGAKHEVAQRQRQVAPPTDQVREPCRGGRQMHTDDHNDVRLSNARTPSELLWGAVRLRMRGRTHTCVGGKLELASRVHGGTPARRFGDVDCGNPLCTYPVLATFAVPFVLGLLPSSTTRADACSRNCGWSPLLNSSRSWDAATERS